MDRSTGPAHGRIDDIEVLRAFAVSLVLVEHARLNLIPWVAGTDGPIYGRFNFWSGVDLFLAISGFVIGRSLLPMLARTRGETEFFNAALSFWARRAWRLLPSALLWLAIILAAAAVFNRSGAFGPFRTNLDGALAAVLDVANFHQAYVFARTPPGAAFPYWSLSLEEQFYLVLPFAVFLARGRLPLLLALVALVQLPVRRYGHGGDILANLTKSDALSLGVLLSIWSQSASWRRFEPVFLRRWRLRACLPPAFLLVFCALSGPVLNPGRFTVGAVALTAAAIVWVASYDGDYVFPRGRFKQAFCWIGARSYAIYLIHIPAFFATREFWFRVDPGVLQPSPAHMAVLLGTGLSLLLVLADLNYRFVENPLRRRGARIAEGLLRRDLGAAGGARAPGYETA